MEVRAADELRAGATEAVDLDHRWGSGVVAEAERAAVRARARAAAAEAAFPDSKVRTPRARRYGEERFWRKAKGRPEECWEWTGCTDPQGRPRVSWRGTSALAARVAWELRHGAEPPHPVVQTCGSPLCVNPAHLALDEGRRLGRPDSRLCPAGHLKDYLGPDGSRRCRECRNAASYRYIARKRAS